MSLQEKDLRAKKIDESRACVVKRGNQKRETTSCDSDNEKKVKMNYLKF